jgi:hypothetical protein
MNSPLITTVMEAHQHAVAAEQSLIEELAYAVLKRDHPSRIRQGTHPWRVIQIKGDLEAAASTTDALSKALQRVRACHPVKGSQL